MRFANLLICLALTLCLVACSGGGGSTAAGTSSTLISIAVTPSNVSIITDSTQQYSAIGTYSDATTHNLTASVTWSSSDTSVATISSSGFAASLATGTTEITATLGGVAGSTTLTVGPLSLVSLDIRPATPSVPLGNSGQFTATGTYNDATTRDLTALVTWGSSDTAVATISNSAGTNGRATTLATGSSVITATSGSVSASTTLTVTAAALVSIDITPVSPSTLLGTPVQFSATGNYTDASSHDITVTATWSSSATSVATVSNTAGSKGLATPISPGTTNITVQSSTVSGSTLLTVTDAPPAVNTMNVTVNGSLCSGGSYPNKPCISVTICSPGTATCQTIDDILLDTGSYGLRLFKQVVTVPLTQTTVGGNSLAECVQYADGSAQWGPVKLADVVLGGEPAVTVPIQVIDDAFGTVPASCGTPLYSPVVAGFNGILGVGLFAEDCGSTCVSGANNGNYFTCSGASCSGSTVPLAGQVQNPVALLPQDNNGVILQLPSAQAGGSVSVNGQLVLGINTRSNNIPIGVTAYPVDSTGSFITIYNGTSDTNSFIDSGSNALFFNSFGTIPVCTGIYADWFCPASTRSLTATNRGSGGSPSGSVAFQIGRASTLFSTFNNVFAELGGNSTFGFDWGLPFFLGRSVYVGISGRGDSSLGSGPYWAY